jgi:hypothetical protein
MPHPAELGKSKLIGIGVGTTKISVGSVKY